MHSRRDADVEEPIVETGQGARHLAVHAHFGRGPARGWAGQGPRPGIRRMDLRFEDQRVAGEPHVESRSRDAVGLTGLEPRQAVLHLVEHRAVRNRDPARPRVARTGPREGAPPPSPREQGLECQGAAVDQKSSGEQQDEQQPHQRQEPVHARRDEPESDRLIALHRSGPAEAVVAPGPARHPGSGLDDRARVLLERDVHRGDVGFPPPVVRFLSAFIFFLFLRPRNPSTPLRTPPTTPPTTPPGTPCCGGATESSAWKLSSRAWRGRGRRGRRRRRRLWHGSSGQGRRGQAGGKSLRRSGLGVQRLPDLIADERDQDHEQDEKARPAPDSAPGGGANLEGRPRKAPSHRAG